MNIQLNEKKKPIILVECPISTISGYGVHSRILVKSLIKMGKYDIKIFPKRWGSTPLNALDPIQDKEILDLIVDRLDQKPDIHIQVSIPNEFEPKGIKSIGVTAGSEVTIAPLPFIQGCNKMDLVLVPSKFTKDVLIGTKYDRKNDQGQIVETIQVNKPVEVLFEALDLNVFQKIEWI